MMSDAALSSVTSYTFDANQNLTGFTVASGTYTNLNASTSASGAFVPPGTGGDRNQGAWRYRRNPGGGGDGFFNFWASGASEVDGFGGVSNLNLNAGTR